MQVKLTQTEKEIKKADKILDTRLLSAMHTCPPSELPVESNPDSFRTGFDTHGVTVYPGQSMSMVVQQLFVIKSELSFFSVKNIDFYPFVKT